MRHDSWFSNQSSPSAVCYGAVRVNGGPMAIENLAQIQQTMLAFVNEDHRIEAQLLRALAEALQERLAGTGAEAAVGAAWAALLTHTRAHFDREESAMLETDFPQRASHKAEHDRLLGEMTQQALAYEETHDGQALLRFVSETVPAWFLAHASTLDFVAARFITAQRA